MKKKGFIFTLGIFMSVAMVSCNNSGQQPVSQAPAAPSKEELVKRGEYLVTTIGCADCHSPKRMGAQGPEVIPELMLSGYPADRPMAKVDLSSLNPGWGTVNEDFTTFAGPWGQSFAANITPDQTGIGGWTEEQFRKALTQGWFRGIENSRRLMPPMPWQNFANMTDEDVKAIYLYLMTIPPIRNEAPEPIPPGGH